MAADALSRDWRREMTKTPDSPPRIPWLDPFEAGRQWMEIAGKAQNVVSQYMAESSAFQAYNPKATAQAFAEFFALFFKHPEKFVKAQSSLWEKYAELWQTVMNKDAAEGDGKKSKDRRFKSEEWEKNVTLNVVKHSYLIGSEWLKDLVSEETDLSPQAKKQVAFFTQQYIDAMAPTNFALTNPDVMRKTIETGGANLVRGFSNLLDDIESRAGHVRRAAQDAFTLGVNLAATKGSVVLRTDMMELIQYEPTTEIVSEIPLLLVPPWVNKYYLFDLQQKTSFIKWAVDRGFTVFTVSWVNPDESHANKDFQNYWFEGPNAAFEVIEKATAQRQVNLIGYCLGGTLTASGLAYLAARGDHRVSSATLLAAMTDFQDFGDFEVFVTEEQIDALEAKLKNKGYVESADLSMLFSMLRANDLIWSSAISSYLLAENAVASDLLYWFSDGIGMPAKMLNTFMRSIILDNSLTKPGKLKLDKTPIDLQQIKTPLCFVSLKDDHVAAWQATYKGATHFKAPKRFILGGSGHNAGTINPPAARKHGYWTNPEFPDDPEQWLAGASKHEGSWWTEWASWLKERSKGDVDARPVEYGPVPVLEPAPGSYARVRR
jgi:poly[(R)-3-hydroxyalkanoate] polymerase subunit PhaC